MTGWQRFIALWTHRYKKYTHILIKYLRAYRDAIRVVAMRLFKGKEVVAIVLSEQFGDIVTCEPVSREVRKLHPKAHILWIVRKPYIELVEHNPHLNGYLIETCVSYRNHLLRLNPFNKVYNLHLSGRRCHYCQGFSVNPISDKAGITYENYFNFGDLLYVFSMAAGLPPIDDQPRLYVPESAQQRVASLKLPSNPIVLHCKPSYPEKDWQPENWDKLVHWLLETYPNPIIEIGLESELTFQHPRILNLCGQLSILETSEVIRMSQLFIGVESGPGHLANAVGAEAIIIYGKTGKFTDYNPYAGAYGRLESVTLLNRIGYYCADLPLEWVQEAVTAKMSQPISNQTS